MMTSQFPFTESQRVFKRKTFIVAALIAFFAMSVGPASAAPLTFDVTGFAGLGSLGNTLTFSQSGVTLNLTGWGYTYSALDNAFEKGALGQWGVGVGVCNAAEGASCQVPEHQVDDSGPRDWVLFLFSEPVDVQTVVVDPYGVFDRDVRYFVGTVSSPLDLTGKTYADLVGLGFLSPFDDTSTPSDEPRAVAITGGGFGNALLFGPLVGGEADGSDEFKITSVSVQTVPDAGSSMLLLGTALAALAGYARRR